MERTILIIGAGPAALYAAQKLAKEGHNSVIVNRDLRHGGLAEFGIYPNKYKMKSGLRKMFDKILSDERVHYFGNVTVGVDADLTLDELRSLGFDATIVAVGAQGTKWLGLPGEELNRVYHAKDLVYHYNGLPPFSEREFEIGENVAVIGMGNVCLDIVHWLVCDKKVKNVTAIARRGPAERKYTEKEMKIVSGALDIDAIHDDFVRNRDTMLAVSQDPDALEQEIIAHRETPLETESPTTFGIRFFRSPKALVGEGSPTGVLCDVTELVPKEGGTLGAKATGESEVVPCDTVIFAIGDSIEDSIGLPLDARGSTFATVTDVWHEGEPRYMVANADGSPMLGTFVVGWARRASEGLVGKARQDAVNGCGEVLAYLDGEFGPAPEPNASFVEIVDRVRDAFNARDLSFVEYEDIKKLVEIETALAEEKQLPEFKFQTTTDMLNVIRGNDA